ncbi:MAG TPA: PVC-type heme-binding CxxCH protein [Pirellulales bacterium]|nr:PVC-type heme-binding CxxCH protein [Pirellulales bacterium]
MSPRLLCRCLLVLGLGLFGGRSGHAEPPAKLPAKLKILFLGDNGHHQPHERFKQLQPVLEKRGIELTYSADLNDLNAQHLAAYDGLLIYANAEKIEPGQEQALLDFVEGGKGLIALHCASYCFLNSPKYVALVGAQFKSHNTGTFRVQPAPVEHPILKGFGGFESWDETYVHTKHNTKDRTVLEYRVEGDLHEPWTWVRTQGRGRVFYTAWGHDERTWGNRGFQNLVERGIRWACGQDPALAGPFADQPKMNARRTDLKPFEYVDATVPFYAPSGKSGPKKKMQLPLEPAESLKHMVLPVGFEARLFVSDAELGGKPICMNWDERGRLWVAVTVDYPNEMQPPGAGRDKILICEDTTGAGKADKITVFADKLSIPTSLIFARGGVIVQQAPDTLFLKSSKDDDHCDERKVLFSGWGIHDTHAGPSNLHYGFDNWIYGMVGYSGFDGTVGGEHLKFNQGFYRFLPDGSKLELLRNTNNNSWGLGFSEEGILFGSTANGNPSVYMPIPNRYYESVRGWSSSVLGGIAGNPPFAPITDNVRQVDFHGHFTAAAGHALYTARNYPKTYWNRTAFVCEPTGHLLATFEIEPQGADFRSHVGWNLLASDDEWTAPIAAEVGPDGNVWMIDWYNYIVQHNPTPAGFKTGKGGAYETNLRDKTHGRIYRLVYTGDDGKQFSQPPDLAHADLADLCSVLRHENMFWRMQAQRLLVERHQPRIGPLLLQMLADQTTDSEGLNTPEIHAIWALQGLGLTDGQDSPTFHALIALLKHPSASVRRAAVQVLPRTLVGAGELAKSHILNDPDPQVRLAAFLAASEARDCSWLFEYFVQAFLDDANLRDPYLLDGLTIASAAHARGLFRALAHRAVTADMPAPPPGPRQLAYSPAALERLTIVANHYARGAKWEPEGDLLTQLTQMQPDIAAALISGFDKGWPKNTPVPLTAKDEDALETLVKSLPAEARGRLVSLARRLGSKRLEQFGAEISAGFKTVAEDAKASVPERIAAARQLIEFRKSDPDAAAGLIAILSPRTGPELAAGLLEALSHSEAPDAGKQLLAALDGLAPGVRSAAVRVLLARPVWTNALLDAVEQGKLSLSELAPDQRAGLIANPDPAVQARARALLAKGHDLPNPDRQKVIDELQPLTLKTGDPALGKLVFTKNCAKCHTHGGEGGKVGPDLTGMSVHPKDHFLIDIFDPSRSVEGNFRVYRVATADGRMFNGLLASETKNAIELIDAEAKHVTLQRDEIEELIGSKKSLMPEGFEKLLKPDDIVNLLEFLTQKGRYVPLSLDKVATVVTTKGMFYSEESSVERMIFPDWKEKKFNDVPFLLVDPQGDRVKNAIMLYSPNGKQPPHMPKSVLLDCNSPVRAIHLLSGVSGWGAQAPAKDGSVSLIVRLHYADGKTEDHPLKNGVQFADYIGRFDVPESKFAFGLRGQQIRYLSVPVDRPAEVQQIEFVKGPDATAPIIMAVTIERPNSK